MPTLYAATFESVAVTAQQDFFELLVPTGVVAVIHRVLLTQSTEIGDAQEEGLSIRFRKGNTTSGTGGTTPTPSPLEGMAPTFASVGGASGAVEVNNTTKATAGTAVVLHREAWNVRGAFDYRPTPEERIYLAPASRFCVELATTPADSITMDGTLIFELIGG